MFFNFKGIIGNTTGLFMLFKKRNFILVGPKHIYVYLFVVDTFYLLMSIKIFLQNAFDIDFEPYSIYCKIFTYLGYVVSSIPSWLAVYITLERYMSLEYASKSKHLQNSKTQLFYFVSVIFFNFISYIPVIFYENNSKDIFIQCDFSNYSQTLLFIILINRMIFPFSIIIICSFLLINDIYRLKDRVFAEYSFDECARFKRNVRASFMSILVNVAILLLNLPLLVVHFFYYDSANLRLFAFYLFVFNYGINFYLIVLSNKIFRNELLNLVLKKKSIYFSFIDNDSFTSSSLICV